MVQAKARVQATTYSYTQRVDRDFSCRAPFRAPDRYETDFFVRDEEIDECGGGGGEDSKHSEEDQFHALSYILSEYILDGSPNEVNLR